MINPTQADIGRRVIYRDPAFDLAPEEGVISSFNDSVVFVRYGASRQAQATRREDLEWSHRRPEETAVSSTMVGGKTTRIEFCEPPQDPRGSDAA